MINDPLIQGNFIAGDMLDNNFMNVPAPPLGNFEAANNVAMNMTDVHFYSEIVDFKDDTFNTNTSEKIKNMFIEKMNLYKNFLNGDMANLSNNGIFSHLRETLIKEFEKIYEIDIDKDLTKLIEFEKKRTPFHDQKEYSSHFHETEDNDEAPQKQTSNDTRGEIDIHDSPVIAARMLKERATLLNQGDNIDIKSKIDDLLENESSESNMRIINEKYNISFSKLRDICHDVYERIQADCKEMHKLNCKITKYAKQFDKYNAWILNTQDNIDDCEDICKMIEIKIEKWFTKNDVIGDVIKYQQLKKKRESNNEILSIFKMFTIFKTNCDVCRLNTKNYVFVPCGHTYCGECSSEINECAICKSKVMQKIKFYL